MPIYELTCGACGRLTSVFTRRMEAPVEAPCRHCGSTQLSRAPSRFAYHKSAQRVLEEYGDPARDENVEYRDPRQIGRWVEKKFDEYGMELPQEARRMIDAAREGEFPQPVKDL